MATVRYHCACCNGKGWRYTRPTDFPIKCDICDGRGGTAISVAGACNALRISRGALRRLEAGQDVFLETSVRVLDRIAKIFPEALR